MISSSIKHEALSAYVDQLSPGERIEVPVTGHSMVPSIRPGDRVTIECDRNAAARFGDLVAFHDPEHGLVVHRVIWRARALRTRGDAANFVDRPVTNEAMIGRVVEIHRGTRTWRPGRIDGVARASRLLVRSAARRLRLLVTGR